MGVNSYILHVNLFVMYGLLIDYRVGLLFTVAALAKFTVHFFSNGFGYHNND